MPLLFIPKEITEDEARVAAVPETIKQYAKRGFQVTVESGAGAGSFITDAAFEEAGASITTTPIEVYQKADVVLKIQPPHLRGDLEQHEAKMMKSGAVLISFLWPMQAKELVQTLAEQKITAFAMDQIPRISRAQSMDALSSQSNIAGYKAVLLAADALPKMFPMMMTAAGTIKPARVVIIGAGVAGLQAIATAKRLGAIVEVSDIRPDVKEQIESLGGRFIEVKSDEKLEDKGGYAKEVSEAFKQKQQAVLREHITAADVVITTALVPGKPAPMLIPAETVKAMAPGSVIVDLAVGQGGNCALSEEGKVVVKEGVTIIGHRNLPALQPINASAMYAKNVLAVIRHLFDKEGASQIDLTEEINDGSIVTHDGAIRAPFAENTDKKADETKDKAADEAVAKTADETVAKTVAKATDEATDETVAKTADEATDEAAAKTADETAG